MRRMGSRPGGPVIKLFNLIWERDVKIQELKLYETDREECNATLDIDVLYNLDCNRSS